MRTLSAMILSAANPIPVNIIRSGIIDNPFRILFIGKTPDFAYII